MIKSVKINYLWLNRIFWASIILLTSYYLYRAFYFRFIKEGLGPTLWNKQFWYVFHIATAISTLLLGPFQFWNWFRKRYLRWHRLLGKIYIVGALVGGASAFYLGATIKYPGSVIPLMLSSFLWVFVTAAAWITILKKNVQGHRLFMIRSYTLALSFVFIRILSDLVNNYGFLSFIPVPEVRDATYEWASWIVPLLVVEFFISWLPSVKQKKVVRTYPVKSMQQMEL